MTEARALLWLFVTFEVLWVASLACLWTDHGPAGAIICLAALVPLLGFMALAVRRLLRLRR